MAFTHRLLSRVPAALLALLLARCVEAPPDMSGSDNPLADRLGCLGQIPACLEACTAGDVVASASCDHGVWRCATGVRADLCCDPLSAPDSCPTWAEACDGPEGCRSGYTCVHSRAFPIPVPDGDAGLCRLGDWHIAPYDECQGRDSLVWPEALLESGIRPVQIEGVVGVDPLCEDRDCDPADPCCQQCTGSYTLGLVTSDGRPFAVALRTQTLACAGTNCGFSCAPLQPGRRYRVWGLWDPTEGGGSGTLLYAGHCDD